MTTFKRGTKSSSHIWAVYVFHACITSWFVLGFFFFCISIMPHFLFYFGILSCFLWLTFLFPSSYASPVSHRCLPSPWLFSCVHLLHCVSPPCLLLSVHCFCLRSFIHVRALVFFSCAKLFACFLLNKITFDHGNTCIWASTGRNLDFAQFRINGKEATIFMQVILIASSY